MLYCTKPPYFGKKRRYVENTKFGNSVQKHVISGRTSDTLGKQSSYLRSAKIEDSTDMTFNIKYMKLKKLKIFIFVFFTFIVTKFQISFDYDEVLHKIYNMQKKGQNRLKIDEVIDKIARAANLKWTDFSYI